MRKKKNDRNVNKMVNIGNTYMINKSSNELIN